MSLNKNDVYKSQLQAQLDEYRESYKKEKKKADNRYKYMTVIAEKVCSAVYGESQLGGKNKMLNMSDTELRDFIIADHTKQKGEYLDAIRSLQNVYLKKESENTDLAKQILELENKNKVLSDTIEAAKENLKKAQAEAAKGGASKNNTPIFTNIDNIQKQAEDENICIVKGKPVDLKKLEEKLTHGQKTVLESIGTAGLSETGDIKNYISEKENVKETKAKEILDSFSKNELEDTPVIRMEDAGTPVKPNRKMYVLTSLGKRLYKKIYSKDPTVSEAEKLRKEHSSLKHGLCIKDTAELLTNMGYHDVRYFDKDNTFPVSGGQRYVPDITAKTDKDEITFWEVELAHHNDHDFFDKLEKATRITNELFIIANDSKAKIKLKQQVSRYVKKKIIQKKKESAAKSGKTPSITFYVFTMTELRDKKIFKEMGKKNSQSIIKL